MTERRDSTPAWHRLIGAEASYYTGKVRAYLRYKGIPFEEIGATRDIYREVIVPRTGVAYIPILISDDDVAVQDSTAIIDFMEQRYPSGSVYPDGPMQRLVALLFEVYADEWLILPAMHYRWNVPENRAFAIREFGRLSAPNASRAEQRAIGESISRPFAEALPALGVNCDTAAAIEASYLAFLRDFAAHLEAQPFLLGTRPSIGDFALLGPLYAHLYRDPESGRVMRQHAPRVADWVDRMNALEPCSGGFASDDRIAETLVPLLRRMFEEQGPVLVYTIQRLETWTPENDRRNLPRSIGMQEFRLGSQCSQRAIYPFNIWRWQRPYDHYHALAPGARARADELLARVGGVDVIQTPIRRRVQRRENRLFVD
jgi:glutathione S-transferase